MRSTGKVALSTDSLLRQGVNQVISRVLEREDKLPQTPARFGLGIVCNGRDIVFVKVDLENEKIPIYISKALKLKSAEGLRFLARFLCTTSCEEFGMPKRNVFTLQKMEYVRALGSGGYADVAVVREAGVEHACKIIRDDRHSSLLVSEAKILSKLETVDGVPKVIRCEANKLLLSPVGTPLKEYLAGLNTKQRQKFAKRVLDELPPLLAEAHARGVIHGDIRPENIVVVDGKIYLIDWGCAIDKSQQGEQKQAFGYPPFMSDDLLTGRAPTPEDDYKALMFTYLAIHESPDARAPWPHAFLLDPSDLIGDRTNWLEEYASSHTKLDLSLVVKSSKKAKAS